MQVSNPLSPASRTLLVAFFLVGSVTAIIGTVNSMQFVAVTGLSAAGSAVGWFVGKSWAHRNTSSQ